MVVRLIAGSSRLGKNSIVQNADQRDFSGNIENTPLLKAARRTGSNINKDSNAETRTSENLEYGIFLALRFDHNRQTHTHHS